MLQILKNWVHLPTEREKQHLDPKVFKKILIQTTVLPVLLMILLSIAFVQQISFLLEENDKVRLSDQMINFSTLALKSAVDGETGFRGFIITGKEEFLNPWYQSKRQFRPLMEKLKTFNRDNRGQVEILEHIILQHEKWNDSAHEAILNKRNGKVDQPIEVYESRKKIMDDIRQSFEQFVQTEEAYRNERWIDSRQSARLIMISTVLLGILLGLLLAYVVNNQLRNLSDNYRKAFDSIAEATDRIEATVEVRTRELQTVNKELEAFSYSISHDLKAPLRGIDGFSQILQDEYSDKLDAEAVRYLQFIRQGVEKMTVLIDDLIKLSRLTRSEFKKEEVDIAILADELIKELTVPNPERVVQFKNFDSEIVLADPVLFRLALQNLIKNAWKFSSGREVTIIECGKTEKDGQKAFFIRDNGVGFDMRFYDKLFQPFQRLHPKEKFEGLGMGLATTARIIRRHGGVIWAESVVGEGSTFYFTLDTK